MGSARSVFFLGEAKRWKDGGVFAACCSPL